MEEEHFTEKAQNQFLLEEKVEFFHENGWCKGKIVHVIDEFRYKIQFLDCMEEKHMEFEQKDLRVYSQDQDIGTKYDHDDVRKCDEMKEGEQYESSETHEGTDSIQARDQQQCSRTKHKRRCSIMPSPGSIYCEKHHLERDAYNERRRKGPKIENRYITHLPSGELRCRKTGRQWQCPEKATSGLYCERHGLNEDIRNKNRRKGDGRPNRALMAILSVGEGQSRYSGNEGSNNAQMIGLKLTMDENRDCKIGDVMTNPNRKVVSSGAVDPGRKVAKSRSGRKRLRDEEIIPDENEESGSGWTQTTAIFEPQTDKQTRDMIPENSIENPLCKTPTSKIAEVVRTEVASTTDNGIGNIGIISTELPVKWNESQNLINEVYFRKAIEDELNDTIMLSFWTDHNSDDELQENAGVITTEEVMSVVDSSRGQITAERDIAETEKDIPIPAEYIQIDKDIEDLHGPLQNGQLVGDKENVSQGINTEHDHADVGKCDQIKEGDQYESPKSDEQYHSPSNSMKMPDQRQCVRDGKRWRCSNMASPGSIYCMKHHLKRGAYNEKRRKGPKIKSRYITDHLPSGELRCRKTGKRWQCHEKATSGLYCDKHGLKEDIRNKNRRKGDGRPSRVIMTLLAVGQGQSKYSGNEGSSSAQLTGLKLTMENNRDSKIRDVMTNPNRKTVSSGAVDPGRKVAKRRSGEKRLTDKETIPDENEESGLARTQTIDISEPQTREMITENSIEGIGNIGIKCTESPMKWNESQNPIDANHFQKPIGDELNDTVMMSFWTDHDSDDQMQENEGLITTEEVMSAVNIAETEKDISIPAEQIEAERDIAETEKDISIPAEQIEAARDIAETEKEISIPAEKIEAERDIAETEKDIFIPAEQRNAERDIAEKEKDISIPAEQIEAARDITETEKDISIPAEKIEAARDIAEMEKDISIPAEQRNAERDIAETEKDISIPAEQIEAERDIAEAEKNISIPTEQIEAERDIAETDISIPTEQIEAERDIAETEKNISIPAEYKQIYKEIKDLHGPLENGQSVGEKESVSLVTLIELLKMAHKFKCLTVESVTETMISDFKRTIEIGRLFNYNVQWLDENLKRLTDLYKKRCSVVSLEQDVRSCNILLEATQEEVKRMEEAFLIAKKKFDDMVISRDNAVAKLVAAQNRFAKFELAI